MEGREHASSLLVSRYGPRVMGYCRDLAPDLSDVDCEHIVACAIERAVSKIEKFDPDRAKFGTWIRGFVLYAVRDWRRDHERLQSFDDEERALEEPAVDALGTLFTHKPTASETQPVSERNAPLLAAVQEALSKIRHDDLAIIALRDIEGRSVEVAAASLGINRDACRKRHSRAKMRLKDLLRTDPRCAFIFTGETE